MEQAARLIDRRVDRFLQNWRDRLEGFTTWPRFGGGFLLPELLTNA